MCKVMLLNNFQEEMGIYEWRCVLSWAHTMAICPRRRRGDHKVRKWGRSLAMERGLSSRVAGQMAENWLTRQYNDWVAIGDDREKRERRLPATLASPSQREEATYRDYECLDGDSLIAVAIYLRGSCEGETTERRVSPILALMSPQEQSPRLIHRVWHWFPCLYSNTLLSWCVH